GLRVETRDGRRLGRVKAVLNFGAGDMLEIEGEGGSQMLPFTKRVVPVVDLAGGRLVADPPDEVEAR
ncbi:MAG TPA: PRC-barrel domain-containing protein, partial [Hypericibacter adhaerens]|uniref:PRC-barrel domain-containing protein n=1 Tax=Hypericibacter adhaerens TaxID=2602016 RepID=UPI002C9A2E4A